MTGHLATGAVVVDARRTPVRKRNGALAGFGADRLAAAVLGDLAARMPHGMATGEVVLGSSRPLPGNLARIAALAAGLGDQVPGVTVDRQCGGGLESVRLAAALIGNGDADVVLAAGVDSASETDGASSVRTGPSPQARFTPPGHPDPPVGAAADALAAALGIARAAQDAYAARSYALTRAARLAGRYRDELVPLLGTRGSHDTGSTSQDSIAEDDPVRSMDLRTLGRLRPAFSRDGTVTAGNASGIADGAAGVTLVSEQLRAARALPGLRIIGSAVAGSDPALPGLGAVEATRAVLERTGVKVGDLAVLEVIEAFAAQVLALTRSLGLPDPAVPDTDAHDTGAPDPAGRPLVCPDGGAIASGHPWGASGTMLLVRLFGRLVRQASSSPLGTPVGALGLATCAVAGGQGVALLVERVG